MVFVYIGARQISRIQALDSIPAASVRENAALPQRELKVDRVGSQASLDRRSRLSRVFRERNLRGSDTRWLVGRQLVSKEIPAAIVGDDTARGKIRLCPPAIAIQ